MQQARYLILILATAFTLSQSLMAEENSPIPTADETTQESNAQSKHGSCQQLCLADGEDPMDCEQYCIQVVISEAKVLCRLAMR